MSPAEYRRELLEKPAAVDEQFEALRAQEYLLGHQRTRLEYLLRNSGYRSPAAKARE